LKIFPRGVISLDAKGVILRVNSSVSRMFGITGSEFYSLEGLVGADAARHRELPDAPILAHGSGFPGRSRRWAAGRVLHLAVTVEFAGGRAARTPATCLVLDDLTEVLRAQKSAAWQEVARRIAHEIKNPLTPIQLSAQRLLRFLEKSDTSQSVATRHAELAKLVQECFTPDRKGGFPPSPS